MLQREGFWQFCYAAFVLLLIVFLPEKPLSPDDYHGELALFWICRLGWFGMMLAFTELCMVRQRRKDATASSPKPENRGGSP